jgi:OOP family OmpA-OmpF porin
VAAGQIGTTYELTIVERAVMSQQVTANAASMALEIGNTGRVALYGIYFDFDKSTLKPESKPALDEIAKLLGQDAQLKLYVVGHTDNVGEIGYNMTLSQARAEAVVKSLTEDYGINAGRLKAFGVGPLAPVASNRTDEGRAKNRRVELVGQ